jgi:hypothetical protein
METIEGVGLWILGNRNQFIMAVILIILATLAALYGLEIKEWVKGLVLRSYLSEGSIKTTQLAPGCSANLFLSNCGI